MAVRGLHIDAALAVERRPEHQAPVHEEGRPVRGPACGVERQEPRSAEQVVEEGEGRRIRSVRVHEPEGLRAIREQGFERGRMLYLVQRGTILIVIQDAGSLTGGTWRWAAGSP